MTRKIFNALQCALIVKGPIVKKNSSENITIEPLKPGSVATGSQCKRMTNARIEAVCTFTHRYYGLHCGVC